MHVDLVLKDVLLHMSPVCSVTWDSLWGGCYWWRCAPRLQGDIWSVSGKCARNDMLQLCLFFTLYVIEKVTYRCCRAIQRASLSISPITDNLLREGHHIVWHWPSQENISHQLAHLNSQSHRKHSINSEVELHVKPFTPLIHIGIFFGSWLSVSHPKKDFQNCVVVVSLTTISRHQQHHCWQISIASLDLFYFCVQLHFGLTCEWVCHCKIWQP